MNKRTVDQNLLQGTEETISDTEKKVMVQALRRIKKAKEELAIAEDDITNILMARILRS